MTYSEPATVAEGEPISWFGPDVEAAYLAHLAAGTPFTGPECAVCLAPLDMRRQVSAADRCPSCPRPREAHLERRRKRKPPPRPRLRLGGEMRDILCVEGCGRPRRLNKRGAVKSRYCGACESRRTRVGAA